MNMPVLEESLPDTDCGCSARILPLRRRPLWSPILFTLHTGIPHRQKRSGICWEKCRGRMIRRSEVLWVQGWEEKIGGIIREERVGAGKTRGDNTRLSAGRLGAKEKGRARESSWQPEKPRGAIWRKGGQRTGLADLWPRSPFLANIPCPADLWTAQEQ